ncbi:hypothetical protein [Pectobacterium carotovorum]|uniref:hypothetical protein n=1 Tax=Pectobacterium carotovorum TaxID=554 RepID=UPI0018F72A55|nr:hypothetical protein [Pectobacterium carotovorum]
MVDNSNKKRFSISPDGLSICSDIVNLATTRNQFSQHGAIYGIDQVGIAAVNQMDQTTQQNAAPVEEPAAAALSLQEQVDLLVRAVSEFKVTGNQSPIPAPQLTHRTLSPKTLLPVASSAAHQISADWISI